MTMNTRLSILFACGAAAAAGCGEEKQLLADSQNLYQVVREDLPLTVKENAELQAIRVTIVRSEVEGNATLLSLIEEGAMVKQGDKLFDLDVSELVDKRANQEIAVEKAKSAWEQARTQQMILEKELTTKHNTAASQLLISRLNLEKFLGAARKVGATGRNADMVRRLRDLIETPVDSDNGPQDTAGGAAQPAGKPAAMIARVDPRNYAHLVDQVVGLLAVNWENAPELLRGDPLEREMGELANKVLQQADQIRLAMADLKVKEETYAHSQRLEQKQFITRNELERDKLSWQSQESKVTIAWKDLELLINYTLPTQRIQLRQDLENDTLELERVEAQNDAERKKSEFDVDAKRREYEVAKERLENLVKQIGSAICYAPTPGIVVYARISRDRRSMEAVTEGTQVRERQEIIELPDNTRMRCDVKVQEAQVDRVAVGQPAHITVEAFPHEIFTGRVTRVSPTADSNSSWGGSDKKVYTVIVDLDGENADGRLRTRMAAGVTITVGLIKDAVTVPQQAVRRDRSVNYVWKQTKDGPVAVPVKVGAYNQEKVEIVEGIADGDVVYRTPPRSAAEPRFEQPELPELPAGAAIPQPAAPQQPARGNGATGEPGSGGGENQGPGGQGGEPGQTGRAGRGMPKPFAEMTPEEIEDYKTRGLDRMAGTADRIEDAAVAEQYRAGLDSLRKALGGGDLVEAQRQADALRATMMSAFAGRRGPGGGQDGQGGPGGGTAPPGGGQGSGGGDRRGGGRRGEGGGER
jgi:multidrug resistance efflux pump